MASDRSIRPRNVAPSMSYRVFEVRPKDRDKLEAALADDTVSRQSVAIRDASQFGYPDRETIFVFVEGAEAGVMRAEALILEFGRRAASSEELYAKLKAEEDEAASGLGFVLGG